MRMGEFIFWAFFTVATVMLILSVMASASVDKDRLAFIDACETMGGVAIVGTHGTRACFKSEVLK